MKEENRSTPNAIEFNRLSKSYGAKKAVDELTASIAVGDIYGLVGPNGAGKTTTIRMLAGLVFPDGGDAFVMGTSIRQDIHKTALRTGFMLESPAFYPHLSGFDNLLVYSCLSNHSAKSRIKQVLDEVGLTKEAGVAYQHYSLGMKKRLDLARLLLKDPDIFVLDEPTNGLDPYGIQWLHDLLRKRAKSGKTILFSSHLLHDVEKLCTRVAFINHGRILHEEVTDPATGGPSIKLRIPNQAALEKFASSMDPHIFHFTIEGDCLVIGSPLELEPMLHLLAQSDLYPSEIVTQDKLEGLFFQLMGDEGKQP